jgi:isoamylase
MSPKILPGRPDPLGTPSADGTNFAVASAGDEVTLCLFDADGAGRLGRSGCFDQVVL